jgi:phosphoglycolate phosphatase
MPPLTVVFDLDGTLVDTAPDLIRATNHVMGLIGLSPVPEHEIRPLVSFGSRRMIERGLELNAHTVAADELDRLWRTFLDFYADNIAVDSRPYPMIEATLDALEAQGARLAVCTNKIEGLSRTLLATLGLADRFDAICGRDTFPVCKPHPDHLTGAVARAGGDPVRAIMVGDSDTDVDTARAARIPIIGVTFGYSGVPMRELAPDAVIDHYAEFGAALARLQPR